MKLLGRPASGDIVLDIGSGQGELALLLQREFRDANVVGIEYSAEGVLRARAAAAAAGLPARFAQRDLLEPATVDPDIRGRAAFAVCSEVLEHVDDPGLLLRNAAEYLAPGCRMVVTVPGGPRSAFDRHIGHRQHFRPSAVRALLEHSGFDVEYVARAGFPFFNLYRLAVIARGRKLIADLEDGEGGGRGAQGAVLAFFDRAFRFNFPKSPFGWQMVAVGRFAGPRKAP
jgi:SAM-dependent methyltransferase